MTVNVRISSLWGAGSGEELGRWDEAASNCPQTYERKTGEKGIQDAGLTPGN